MTDRRILVTRRWPQTVEERLCSSYSHVKLNVDDEPMTGADLRNALQTYDAVMPTVSDRLTGDLFDADLACRFLGNFGVGYSHIDTAAAAQHGVTVTNTPGVLTDTTADTAMTLLLMAARRAGEGEREVRAGHWTGWRPTHMMGAEVTGKTLGIIGMGRIGQAVARRAHHGFGMRVVFYNRGPAVDHGIAGARQMPDVDAVLAESDFVSLHVPGGDTNRHLIDKRRLSLMKPSAYLVNTARGEVVDQQALIEALRSGEIAGAGLDVYDEEPIVPQDLCTLDNVVLLPHLGSATLETRTAMGMLAVDNLDAFLEGREPPCRVA